MCGNNGLSLVMGRPQSGNYNDLFKLNKVFDEMIDFLATVTISMERVFMNADAGFDCKSFKRNCDEKVIELNVKDNPGAVKTNNQQLHFLMIYCTMKIDIQLKELMLGRMPTKEF